jgi:hypothetical protein
MAVIGGVAPAGVFQNGVDVVIEPCGYFFANPTNFGNDWIRTHG